MSDASTSEQLGYFRPFFFLSSIYVKKRYIIIRSTVYLAQRIFDVQNKIKPSSSSGIYFFQSADYPDGISPPPPPPPKSFFVNTPLLIYLHEGRGDNVCCTRSSADEEWQKKELSLLYPSECSHSTDTARSVSISGTGQNRPSGL